MPTDPLRITVLGAGSCIPDPGGETASFCVNGRLLVDTGWCAARQLIDLSIPPRQIEAILLTHCHHDHFMGLVSMLFHRGLTCRETPLEVCGPEGEISRVVEDVWRLLQTDRYPHIEASVHVRDVAPGDSFEVAGLSVSACAARHNVPGLHYRLTSGGGRSVVFSGDTAFNPDLVDFARGADVLIHEASHGASSLRESPDAAHSGAPDAAQIARQAGVGRLCLVHVPAAARGDALQAAARVFPEVFIPETGDVIAT